MITRTIEMHDVNVVAMIDGQPILYTFTGYVGDISKPNKVLKKVRESDANIIAVTGFSEAYSKRYGMSEDMFMLYATCLDN